MPDDAPPKVLTAEFWAAAEPGRTLPAAIAPEIAFGGRSNVGKSSLLGALTGRAKLVRVSDTPGRTRGVNIFQLETDRGKVAFADLPGYGYAKVSREMRDAWGPLIEGYLIGRSAVRGLVAIVDLRRGFEADDGQLLEFADAHRIEVLVVATKSDKLSKARRKPALAVVERQCGRRAIATSSETGEGLADVWRWIAGMVSRTPPAASQGQAARAISASASVGGADRRRARGSRRRFP